VITLSPRYDTGLHFEKKYIAANGVATGAIEYEHYLYAGGQMFGKYITTTATDGVTQASTATEYYSRDNLGSMVAITDATGTVTQRMSYDIWGKRRYPNGFVDAGGLLNNPDMVHGFTGHEMLDDFELIHMNGRLYDPVMARFVSADPTIQAPGSLQSYNRYSYGWNNPLNGTDPSGFSFWTSIRDIAIRAVAAVADASGCGGYCSAAVGAYQGQRNGGGLTGAIVGGIQGYVGYQVADTYNLTNNAGSILWQNVASAAMINAATGCAAASVTGGNCGKAALSGAMGTVGAAYGNVGAAITGCAAGKINGGSCREGVVNAMETYAVFHGVYGATEYIKQSVVKPDNFVQVVLVAEEAAVLAGQVVVSAGIGVGIAAAWEQITSWILKVGDNYVTPTDEPDKFRPGPKGTKIDNEDGSVWDKNRGTGHGGEQWKRWPNQKDWENQRNRESVWNDGRVRGK